MFGISTILFLLIVSLSIYYRCNKGMARNARGQQTRRFIFGIIASCIPILIARDLVPTASLVLAGFISIFWMLTYPLLYHMTNRKSSPDYENYMDIAMGIYSFGWLSSLILLCHAFPTIHTVGSILVSLIEFALFMIAFSQWIYYLMYRVCVDTNGMKIIQETHYNEIIEFSRSYSTWNIIGIAILITAMLSSCIYLNVNSVADYPVSVWQKAIWVATTIFFSIYIWKKNHGVFSRTGIVKLWMDIKEYSQHNSNYLTELENRLKSLEVKQKGGTYQKPSTIMMVIGESASRDYMSVITPDMEHDTTPWMRQMAEDTEHCVTFKNTYSCAMHTVQALEKALTEYNQYDDSKQFSTACSIVDIAHKLGWRVHWYSNQGHLGAADTPITIVAETSDVAKWTKQELGKIQYDQSLVDFLPEVNPEVNNLLVLHLKGSHFNFLNRYPADKTVWGEPNVQNNVLNFENSIRYTDGILQQFYEYGRKHLNLQAMVYFSDHATIPDRKRSPSFNGFGDTRIPLFVWVSDEYLSLHQHRFDALKANKDKYWTNDLFYELMCGVIDIESNHFDEINSLASTSYRYTREMLTTFDGKAHISDDN